MVLSANTLLCVIPICKVYHLSFGSNISVDLNLLFRMALPSPRRVGVGVRSVISFQRIYQRLFFSVEKVTDPTPAPPRKGRVQEGSGYRRRGIPGSTAILLPIIYHLSFRPQAAFIIYHLSFRPQAASFRPASCFLSLAMVPTRRCASRRDVRGRSPASRGAGVVRVAVRAALCPSPRTSPPRRRRRD